MAKGVTYGPFRPDSNGDAYPPEDRIAADFDMMVNAGVNTVRVYTTPTEGLVHLAMERGLYLLIDVPWPKHIDVYGDAKMEAMCLEMVEEGINRSAHWPNVLGVMIGNEIPPDLARWAGPDRVAAFLKRLYLHAKSLNPDRLLGFANFPSTEFLPLGFFDFIGFNVYLEDEVSLRRYLHRLRHLYPGTPILLSETGLDSRSNGEEMQAKVIDFSMKAAYEAGMAGTLVFSWTDEWHTGGYDIREWQFGLLDEERNPKPAFGVVSSIYTTAPQPRALPATPRISIVVATYNGGETLRECLLSLERLDYPDYEVIVVDDGSTDDTEEILRDFLSIRVWRQENRGLSVARNVGIGLASGEIVAFTDSDCVADADWLYFVALAMLGGNCAGVGGPNLTPWERRPIHRTVAHAPGHATHVLLDIEVAEHVPGCNMAFWRSSLVEAGSFDPTFRKAGDDVDMIWRLQEKGGRILFAPAAFVWHHRRSTIGAYLKQQMGYGEAEALLARKHPHRFNDRGQSLWRGIIYSSQEVLPLLKTHDTHYGVFGSAGFQCIYERRASFPAYFVTSFEWWVVCALLLASGLFSTAALIAGLLGLCLTTGVSGLKAWRQFRRTTGLPGRYFAVVWLLWLLQPIVRGWKRYTGTFLAGASTANHRRPAEESPSGPGGMPVRRTLLRKYWNEEGPDRLEVLRLISASLSGRQWLHSPNTGWEPWDMTVILSQWFRSRLVTAEEDHGAGKRLMKLRLSLIPTSLLIIPASAGMVAAALIAFQDTIIARVLLLVLILAGWVLLRRAMRAQASVAALCEKVMAGEGYLVINEGAKPDDGSRESPEEVNTTRDPQETAPESAEVRQ